MIERPDYSRLMLGVGLEDLDLAARKSNYEGLAVRAEVHSQSLTKFLETTGLELELLEHSILVERINDDSRGLVLLVFVADKHSVRLEDI